MALCAYSWGQAGAPRSTAQHSTTAQQQLVAGSFAAWYLQLGLVYGVMSSCLIPQQHLTACQPVSTASGGLAAVAKAALNMMILRRGGSRHQLWRALAGGILRSRVAPAALCQLNPVVRKVRAPLVLSVMGVRPARRCGNASAGTITLLPAILRGRAGRLAAFCQALVLRSGQGGLQHHWQRRHSPSSCGHCRQLARPWLSRLCGGRCWAMTRLHPPYRRSHGPCTRCGQ